MSANIERLIADHAPDTLDELDAEIAKCLDRLRDLQRRRVVIAMHLAVAQATGEGVAAVLYAHDDHDYTEDRAA